MTTTRRRLAAVEISLSPTERVVAWLTEAHEYGDLLAYVRATIDPDANGTPLDRLVRSTQAAIRAEHSRASPETDESVHEATRDLVFRYHLALRIIDLTDRVKERAELVLLALTLMLNLACEVRSTRRPREFPSLERIRDLLFERAADLHAFGEAREQVETRYLGGQTALFPDALASWTDVLYRTRAMAMTAWGLTDRYGGAPLDEARYYDPDPARVEAAIADLVEPARIKALDDTGEERAAVARTMRWIGPSP